MTTQPTNETTPATETVETFEVPKSRSFAEIEIEVAARNAAYKARVAAEKVAARAERKVSGAPNPKRHASSAHPSSKRSRGRFGR